MPSPSIPDALAAAILEILEVNDQSKAANSELALHLDFGGSFAGLANEIRRVSGQNYAAICDESWGRDDIQLDLERCELPAGSVAKKAEAIRDRVGQRKVFSASILFRPNAAWSEMLALARASISPDSVFIVVAVQNCYSAAADIDLCADRSRGPESSEPALHERLLRAMKKAGFDIMNQQRIELRHEPGDPITSSSLSQLTVSATKFQRFLDRYRVGTLSTTSNSVIIISSVLNHPEDDDLGKELEPFLSIVSRTQGAREVEIREMLLSVTGQNDTDFEHILIGHKLDADGYKSVQSAIEELPAWQKAKTRLLLVEDGGRAKPLNVGFKSAKGEYIAILDDDDLVASNWVEVFKSLAEQHYGSVLRTASVNQTADLSSVEGVRGTVATGPIEQKFSPRWNERQQYFENQTPIHGLAFPRTTFHAFGLRFDETLTTTEDWDFILRATNLLGVRDSGKVTSLYRWWDSASSSRTAHPSHEWSANRDRILNKLYSSPILIEGATLKEFGEALDECSSKIEESRAKIEKLAYLLRLIESRSWRYTAPFRMLGNILRGGTSIAASEFVHSSLDKIDSAVAELQASRSWRMTRWLRRR